MGCALTAAMWAVSTPARADADPMVFTKGISLNDGYASTYCAYHSDSGSLVFSLDPYPSTANCGQGGWSGLSESAIWQAQTSHELQEAATDPFPFGGWTEIGDDCNWGNSASNVTAMSFGAVQMISDGNTMTCSNFTPNDQPAVFVRSSGEADVVVQGPNNSLVYYWATPGSLRPSGEADVVVEGADQLPHYYYAFPGTAWTGATL